MNNIINNGNNVEENNLVEDSQNSGEINSDNNSNWPKVLIVLIIILLIFVVFLFFNKDNSLKDDNYVIDNNSKVETNTLYELKENGDYKDLYINNKKIDEIKIFTELGNIDVKEFNDLLILDVTNPGSKRDIYCINKDGSDINKLDYTVNTYNNEFINHIDSYRIENNFLYIKVNRQYGNGYLDWWCHYYDVNEVAEYEVKYEYKNGKLEKEEVINEITINDKYKNELTKCSVN